jgi:hypothetical protein
MASTQNNKFIQAKKVFPASATSTTHSPKDNQTGRDKKYRQRLKNTCNAKSMLTVET